MDVLGFYQVKQASPILRQRKSEHRPLIFYPRGFLLFHIIVGFFLKSRQGFPYFATYQVHWNGIA